MKRYKITLEIEVDSSDELVDLWQAIDRASERIVQNTPSQVAVAGNLRSICRQLAMGPLRQRMGLPRSVG